MTLARSWTRVCTAYAAGDIYATLCGSRRSSMQGMPRFEFARAFRLVKLGSSVQDAPVSAERAEPT
jgi:hypothetical protein